MYLYLYLCFDKETPLLKVIKRINNECIWHIIMSKETTEEDDTDPERQSLREY